MYGTVEYDTIILKFDNKGEKTGWTYIEVPNDLARKLKPGNKKSFRVMGKLDAFPIKQVALLPMGNGDFIMPLNAKMRKGTGKRHGAMLHVQLTADTTPLKINKQFMECLVFERTAYIFFMSLPKSHRLYFSKWIESAKTEETKAKRIAQAVIALERKQGYGEMLRAQRDARAGVRE